MEFFNFEEVKLSNHDTNKTFSLWMEEFPLSKYEFIDGKYEFLINRKNKTAFYAHFGQHSSKNSTSTCRRKGVQNLNPARKEFDPEGISTSISNGKRAASAILNKQEYSTYRVCILLRSDIHSCAAFIKKQNGFYVIALFNTLNTRFTIFDSFYEQFPSRKVAYLYTKLHAMYENKCDIYSFEELKHFFTSNDHNYPFNREDLTFYPSRNKKSKIAKTVVLR